jgi:hypothetical protein
MARTIDQKFSSMATFMQERYFCFTDSSMQNIKAILVVAIILKVLLHIFINFKMFENYKASDGINNDYRLLLPLVDEVPVKYRLLKRLINSIYYAILIIAFIACILRYVIKPSLCSAFSR